MDESADVWPNGKRIAVAIAVMFETWSEGKAPSYSVQATPLKPGTADYGGMAWATYGGRIGVWRILRLLDRWNASATYFTNARCVEIYPQAAAEILRSGHEIAGHGYTQDELLAYMTPDEQLAAVTRCVTVIAERTGNRPNGWLSPVLAFTPNTVGALAQAGYTWHADVTYTDTPHVVQTEHGALAAVPFSDFTDNRVLRSNPNDLFDVYSSTLDYLLEYEPRSLLVLGLHCHFGGRPMVTAVFDRILQRLSSHSDVGFCRYGELAQWALATQR